MGTYVIACYRPHAGREADLVALVRRHVPRLRELGLATDAPAIVTRAPDGTIVEVFEWASEEAVRIAHEHPGVKELWDAFGELCEYVPIASVPGAEHPFTHLEPVPA